MFFPVAKALGTIQNPDMIFVLSRQGVLMLRSFALVLCLTMAARAVAGEYDPKALGIGCIATTTEAMKSAGTMIVEPKRAGVVVSGIWDGTPAAEAGLRNGDIVHEIDNIEIATPEQFYAALAKRQAGDAVRIFRSKVKLVPVTRPQPGVKATWSAPGVVTASLKTNHAASAATLSIEGDEFQEARWAKCRGSDIGQNRENRAYLYFNCPAKGPILVVRIYCRNYGSESILPRSIILKIDDDKPVTITANPLKTDFEILGPNLIQEVTDEPLIGKEHPELIARLAAGEFSSISMRLQGTNKVSDRPLTMEEMASMMHVCRFVLGRKAGL